MFIPKGALILINIWNAAMNRRLMATKPRTSDLSGSWMRTGRLFHHAETMDTAHMFWATAMREEIQRVALHLHSHGAMGSNGFAIKFGKEAPIDTETSMDGFVRL
jgi:hypothetical protein